MLVEAERLADVADRAARPIRDDGCSQRRALAGILAIDVLNDLLATLVLEIHIDVGRLVALFRNETLHQSRHPLRIDLGYPETEADDGVRRGAPALTQDADAPRVTNDVVDSQEIRLVLQLTDQRELVLDEPPDFRRLARRPTPAASRLRQGTQMRCRRFTGRYELVRIFVSELGKREVDAFEYCERLSEEGARIPAYQLRHGSQTPLGIRMQSQAELLERDPQPNGRQRVLQHPSLAAVHVNVAGCH